MSGRRRLRAVATLVVAGGVLTGAGAAAPDAGPSANGRIAFETDWVGEVPAVHRVDVTTGRSVLQTELEDGMTLVASPDRSTVLFFVASDPEQPSSPSIWRMAVDGSGKERVAFGSSPAWSPDGRKIVFVTAAGAVATATADGGDVRNLAAGRAPAWSPDGRSIAYVADGAAGSSVVLAAADGTGARSIHDGADAATTLAWSPDGAHLAVSTPRSLAIVPVAGGAARVVATGGGHVSWSPDGTRIAFESRVALPFGVWSPREISVLAVAGGAPVLLTVPPYPYEDSSPSWSPGGRELAFVRGMWTKHGFHAHELRIVSAGGGDSRAVANVRQAVSQPIWIGPSSLLLSQIWLHYPYRRGLFGVEPDGTGRTPLVRNGSEPAFSPDGRSIAFVHSVEGQEGLLVMQADGRVVRRLTYSGGNDRSPSWSPDGSRIVFVRQPPGEVGALFTVRSDGTQLTRTRAPTGVHSPAWSPDGRTVAAVRARDRALLAIAVTSGRVRALTRGDGEMALSTQRLLWHPSGERLSFVRRWAPENVYAERRGELWSVGLRGGAPRRLLRDAYDGAWSPDGSRLAVVGAAGRNLRIHTPGGRLLRTLVRSTFSTGGAGVSSVAWQPRCTLTGSSLADRLTAATRAELVCGLGGDDRLAGGLGRDRLFGGDGDDAIEARGGGFDIVGCGAGRDRVFADVADLVGVDCERVTRR